MDIQELRQFIEASDFSPETKQKVAVILAGKAILDYDTYASIKDILQQELDNDFESAGVDVSEDPEVKQAEAEYQAELEDINKEIEEDGAYIDQEMQKIEEIKQRIDKIDSDIKAKGE